MLICCTCRFDLKEGFCHVYLVLIFMECRVLVLITLFIDFTVICLDHQVAGLFLDHQVVNLCLDHSVVALCVDHPVAALCVDHPVVDR